MVAINQTTPLHSFHLHQTHQSSLAGTFFESFVRISFRWCPSSKCLIFPCWFLCSSGCRSILSPLLAFYNFWIQEPQYVFISLYWRFRCHYGYYIVHTATQLSCQWGMSLSELLPSLGAHRQPSNITTFLPLFTQHLKHTCDMQCCLHTDLG